MYHTWFAEYFVIFSHIISGLKWLYRMPVDGGGVLPAFLGVPLDFGLLLLLLLFLSFYNFQKMFVPRYNMDELVGRLSETTIWI